MTKHDLKKLIKECIKEIMHSSTQEAQLTPTDPFDVEKLRNELEEGNKCNCGSGLDAEWELDARGIPLAKVCPKCRKEKLKGFRSDVLSDPNYDADEPIDPDDELEESKKKWIQKALKKGTRGEKPGALHKQLGVPKGETIPAGKLAAAAKKGGKLGKRARLAQTLRKLK